MSTLMESTIINTKFSIVNLLYKFIIVLYTFSQQLVQSLIWNNESINVFLINLNITKINYMN